MNFFLNGHQNGQRLKFWPFKFTLSLVARNQKVGKGLAALLHSTIQSCRVPILLHTESKKVVLREHSCMYVSLKYEGEMNHFTLRNIFPNHVVNCLFR